VAHALPPTRSAARLWGYNSASRAV
jgi:hypothetical protein